jgi:N-acetylglucosamine kinase-like BadF-type ATPase
VGEGLGGHGDTGGGSGGPDGAHRAGGWVLGVDSGGSGVRVALARGDGSAVAAPAACARPAVTGGRGIDADSLLGLVLPLARGLMAAAGAGRIDAACVGAAGMATLGADLRARLPQALDEALGVRELALAGDVVTAYAGALGLRSGAVVAAGTGMIALGTSGPGDGWRRADGWGHLLGDAGGGAWIGREGLDAAMRAHDGRAGGSPALLERLRERFGPPEGLPGQLYPRQDRPAVLASFAPDVAACATADPVAADILGRAAGHIVEAAAAVLPRKAPAAGEPVEVALAGGLFKTGEPLLAPLRARAAAVLPGARLRLADGDPLDGAVRIASALWRGALTLPADPALLSVVHRPDRPDDHG